MAPRPITESEAVIVSRVRSRLIAHAIDPIRDGLSQKMASSLPSSSGPRMLHHIAHMPPCATEPAPSVVTLPIEPDRCSTHPRPPNIHDLRKKSHCLLRNGNVLSVLVHPVATAGKPIVLPPLPPPLRGGAGPAGV